MTALAQTAYLTTRHVRFFLRQPWFIGIYLVQPVIWLLLFGALFKNVVEIPGFTIGASYIDYLVPGVLVMTALFSCGWSGMSIIEDLDRSIMDRLLATPIHRSAIIVGLNLYELVSFAIQALIIGGLALVLGAHFPGGLLGYSVLTLCAMLVGAIVASFSDAMALLLRQREIRHRDQYPADPAADVPVGSVHASQAGARLDLDRCHLQSGQLGCRSRARRPFVNPGLVIRPASDRLARGPDDSHDGVRHQDVPLVSAFTLTSSPGPAEVGRSAA